MSPVTIQGDFWGERLAVNARRAIFHQWEQLEASGCIENFRLAAGEAGGFRAGWFFADSDAYKWLDAAAHIWGTCPDPRLGQLMDDFIALLGRAQAPDGYLFTYNQLHFPGSRWENLQIEHELYCHGHLIEAGVAHFAATGRSDLLDIARRAAGRVVADFRDQGPAYTPGHEEIEIALLRLHQVSPGDGAYLALARQFIEQRGRAQGFGLSLLRQQLRAARRGRRVQQALQDYRAAHPDFEPHCLPPGNLAKKPPDTTLRWYASALSGKYFQQHAPVRRQTVPVGHAVRFAYLETATAMLGRAGGDRSLLPTLERAWEHMVSRRMYVTGGIGALPGLEGFGRDDELDPTYAYAETCAALGSLFWNWEMAQWTGEAKYSELFEWQLYNAAAVGMGLDGTRYLYNNPLACRGGVTRQPWYAIPCCPSNLSRTWAQLGQYVYSRKPGTLGVHQYISSRLQGGNDPPGIEMQSGLPWRGRVRIKLIEGESASAGRPGAFDLELRQPAWSGGMRVVANGEPVAAFDPLDATGAAAGGYDPRPAVFRTLRRAWSPGDVIEIDLEMPVLLRRAGPGVKGHRGKAAVTRGPLVYCLEDVDNPGVDIFTARLNPASLEPVYDETLLGGVTRLRAKTVDGNRLTFIPYFLWANRGPSQMTVWVNT